MSFLRIAASAAIFTVLSAVGATAKPITTTGETNLRKSPGTDSPVLTIIPKGTTVEVGKCSNGWCETSTDGRDGFVIARNLGLASAPRPRPAPQVYDEEVEEVGPPVYGPRAYAGPPVYYGYRPYYGYGPYGAYYGGWGYRGWGWGWRW
jgi:uncharacterized protein YraI